MCELQTQAPRGPIRRGMLLLASRPARSAEVRRARKNSQGMRGGVPALSGANGPQGPLMLRTQPGAPRTHLPAPDLSSEHGSWAGTLLVEGVVVGQMPEGRADKGMWRLMCDSSVSAAGDYQETDTARGKRR
uniref:Uncharacterized protein n=1 Tax=Knipowitschia caucasica TaxID=637954 RepID=A0AAV2MUC2_KNICA